jgi:AraC-like DNA-binding protein
MKYREIKPTGFLGNFVQCFWEYENTETSTEHTILPDGYFDLLAEFKDETLLSIKLTGVWTKPVNVTIGKSTKIFAIRFKLLAAEYLFRQEIKSILNTSKPLPLNFWNINNYQISDFEIFVSGITNILNNSIKHLKEIDNRKLKLFEVIYQNKPNSVNELSKSIFWSSRQINRYFNTKFGFSLKEFLKIIRFKSSFEHISNGELYPDNEYFDQAHFIKESRKYAGTTPKELYKNKNDRFLQLVTTKQG